MEFKEWIKAARDRKGWSQSKLSRRADVPENTIRRLEAGQTVPRWQTLLKLVEALGEAPPVLASYSETLELLGSHSAINSDASNFFPRITHRSRQPSVAA